MPPRRHDFQPRSLQERWEAKVIRAEVGCWLWQGAHDNNGYGKIQSGGVRGSSKVLYAHRVAYELFIGPIPEGKQLDHLCSNKGCVRPDHLEAVTQWENIRRADGWTAQRARATSCIHGHPFTPANTQITPAGHRHCRACNRAKMRERALRRSHAHRDREGDDTAPAVHRS